MRSSASEPGLIKRELTRSFFIISVALLGAQRALTGTTNFRVRRGEEFTVTGQYYRIRQHLKVLCHKMYDHFNSRNCQNI